MLIPKAAAVGVSTTTGESATSRRNAFIGAYLGWMFDGYETFATVLVAAVVVNDLVGAGTAATSPFYVAGLLAVTLISWAIGGLVSGVLADRFGRRRVMLYSILWYSVCAGLTALSPNYAVLLLLRFVTGLGMGAEWGGGSSLVSETSNPSRRGFRIALLQGGFGIGFLIATGLWQVVNDGSPGAWRWMYLFGVLPALLTVFIRRNVSDSELWKRADKDRREAARHISQGTGVSAEARELTRPTIAQLLSDPQHRRRLGLLLIGMLASMCGWWAVSTLIPQFAGRQLAGQVVDVPGAITLVVLAYNAAGVLGYLAMGWLADLFGRKPLIMTFFAGSAVMTPVFFLVPDSLGSLIALAALNGFFTLGQMTWVALYPSELFPTHVRATAMSITFNVARIPTAVFTLVAASLIAAFGTISSAAIIIGCVAYGLGVLIALFMGPETKGQPLPQVSLTN